MPGRQGGEGGAIRVASVGHALFAAALIWLGAMGLSKGDFVQVWQPVPKWVPAREVLAYLCACISLVSGIGLLWQRTAAVAPETAAAVAPHVTYEWSRPVCP